MGKRKDPFVEYLKWASEQVEKWPDWKYNVLGSPGLPYPRITSKKANKHK